MRKNRTKRRRTRRRQRGGGIFDDIKNFFLVIKKSFTTPFGVTPPATPSETPSATSFCNSFLLLILLKLFLTYPVLKWWSQTQTKRKSKNIKKEKQEEPVKRDDLADEDKCVFFSA